MAAALARLAQATKESRFTDGAHRAISYERSVFDAEQGNWPDFRSSSDSTNFMQTWCHGAPGILLSRHVLQENGLADPTLAEDLAVARASTLSTLATLNRHAGMPAHLCCGALGIASLLRVDAMASGMPVAAVVSQAESEFISQAKVKGGYTYFSVDTGSLNLPGMFTGKAGVVLALLEAAKGLQWMPQVLGAGLFAHTR
jgi:lantibiotic modifying enzyme